MIARMPRYEYRPLPETQDWIITKDDGEDLIVINEALDSDERKAALKAAYGAWRRSQGPVAGLLLLLTGAAAWASEEARQWVRTPLGSAVTASAITASMVYGITDLSRDDPTPAAEPPTIVTVQPVPTPSATPSREPSTRATARPRPTPTGGQPTVITVARPTRSAPPTRRPTRSTRPSQQPSVKATTAGPDPVPTGAAVSTPTPPPPPTPPPVATSPPVGVVAEPDTPAAAPEVASGTCGGIALDVRLDPLANVDACLLG